MNSICIYGGGNIAHSLVAVISDTQPVTVITRRPDSWGSRLSFVQSGVEKQSLNWVAATSDIAVAKMADIIFIALPQFAIDEAVSKLILNLKPGTTVVFVPAPARTAEYANWLIDSGCRVVGLQRVPFISRIINYGRSVKISECRKIHKLVVSDKSMIASWNRYCKLWFGGDAEYLSSFLAFTFSNSNPLLHPSRLVVLLNKPYYERMPLFYEEWTDVSSELYVKSDAEMFEVMHRYPEINIVKDYESAFDHYGVKSIPELTRKIRSIPSFRGIMAPYRLNGSNRYVPDLTSRYFTEDVAYGTARIQSLAREVEVNTPAIDMFVERINALLHDNTQIALH